MLKRIFEQVAEGQNVSKKQAQTCSPMVKTMTEHLKRATAFGSMVWHRKPASVRHARVGIATGETMQIGSSKKVSFLPSKELKEAV
jgi:nucleoid DNA-binding protein